MVPAALAEIVYPDTGPDKDFGSTTDFAQIGPFVDEIKSINDIALNTIQDMVQDKAGFLWLATEQGLLRFDGRNLMAFTHDSGDPTSLLDNNLKQLLFDKNGYLWMVMPNSGVSRFDPQTRQFIHFHPQAKKAAMLRSPNITAISLSHDGWLWVASRKGIERINLTTLAVENFDLTPFKQVLGNKRIVYQILEDRQKRLWFYVARHGLVMLDAQRQNLQTLKVSLQDPQSLRSNAIGTITETSDGEIWVGDRFLVYRYNSKEQNFTRFEVQERLDFNINRHGNRSIFKDKDSRVWVASRANGISVLYPGESRFVNLNPGVKAQNSLYEPRMYDIYQDSSGIIWFSGDNGLYKLDPHKLNIQNYLYTGTDGSRLTTTYADKQGQLWVAMRRTLYLKQNDSSELKLMARMPGAIPRVRRDNDGNLVVVLNIGPFFFEQDTGKWREHFTNETVSTDPEAPTIGTIHSFEFDSKGDIWMGQFGHSDVAESGIYRVDTQTLKYSRLLNGFTFDAILPLDHRVLVGTRTNGLKMYNQQNKHWSQFKSKVDISRTGRLFQAKDSRIWAATNSGLGLVNLDTQTVDVFTEAQGLAIKTVWCITQSQDGDLWLATSNGILRFNPDSEKFTRFDKRHGLRNIKFSSGSCTTTTDGNLMFPTHNTLTLFSPDNIEPKPIKNTLPLLLSDFRILNQPVKLHSVQNPSVLKKPINETDELTLSYRDYLFSLKFATSDYNSSKSSRFAYRLAGYNDTWITAESNDNNLTFSAIPPGSYELQIKSIDNPNQQTSLRTIKIHITPPWYKTTIATICYLLATILAIYLYIRTRTARLMNQAAVLESTVTERTNQLQKSRDKVTELLGEKERTFANLSHEFKTPLTLILSPLESLISKIGKNSPYNATMLMMKRNGNQLLRMVEQMLELSRLDSNGEQKQQLYSLKATLDVLLTSFQGLFADKSLKVTLNPFNDVMLELTVDALEMMLTNLLSNAIKYTPKGGEVTVTVTIDAGFAHIAVADTGLGISKKDSQIIFERFTRVVEQTDESIPGAGIGLALVRQLAHSHGGSISLQSTLDIGSTFTLKLPVAHETNASLAAQADVSMTSTAEINALSTTDKHTEIATEEQHNTLPTVLLIDDNPDMLTLLQDTLNDSYHCLTANNGTQGLAIAKEQIPDIVISDVMMPCLSGFEVIQALREDELTCHIPLVLLTAKGDVDSRITGWQQDIDDYLDKPFHPQELIMRLENLLSIRKLLRRHFSDNSLAAESEKAKEQKRLVPVVSEKDQAFIDRFKNLLAQNYYDTEFTRASCAQLLHISERQFSRKINALMGESFPDVLRQYRLEQSLSLFTTGMQIGQISNEVGFASITYYSKCFKAHFGKSPTQHQKAVIL